MAQPLKSTAPLPQAQQAQTAGQPDWYDTYYTPVPANVGTAPGQDALDQMFAYYER